jgi:serine/threonine-protein kinase HipA
VKEIFAAYGEVNGIAKAEARERGKERLDGEFDIQRKFPDAISIINRLEIVKSYGMGALEDKPETLLSNAAMGDDIDQLAPEREIFLNDDYGANLQGLVCAGESSGGARYKVLIKECGED